MSGNSVNTTYSIYSDWDLARLFQNLPMPAADKQTFVADYSALKQNQIDTKGSIKTISERVADAEVRLDRIDAELIVINKRIDEVETIAYMAAIT
jgi:hypothetical protein